MNEYEIIINIWIEKCAEYIWLHNQCIQKISRINKFFIYQIIFISYSTGLVLILYRDIYYYLQVIIGLCWLYSSCLFTFYILTNYKGRYEQHKLAHYRLQKLLDDIYQKSLLMNQQTIHFLTIKQESFRNIIEQSPHVPHYIIEQFKLTFKHFIRHKPYLHTSLFLERNPKEYNKNIINIRYLTKYFKIWKTQCSRRYRRNMIIHSNLGPFYNENKFLYSSGPLTSHGKILQFQNIKLGNNNLEIEIR